MVKLCANELCTGCMACRQKCQTGAISTQELNGFNYPIVDPHKCVDCGMCISACPVINRSQIAGLSHNEEEKCIAAWNKDDSVRMSSSSGGVFSVLAEKIINEGGVVFGAAWDDDLTLVHEGIEDFTHLDRLRRSKYVQSDTKDTFCLTRHFLNDGRKVLYCGTPCQIAGLKFFLNNNRYDNLLCVDVLCQGVPSPKLFRKYIAEVENETGIIIEDCNFRTKEYGWRFGLFMLKLLGKRRNKHVSKKMILENNSFYDAFYKEYFMRPSCYNCCFKNERQGYYSDITIADFWRIGNKIPFNAPHIEKGISAVVINTEKGKYFFNSCLSRLETAERTFGEFATNDGLRCSQKPNNNDEALEYLQSHTWRETQRVFFPVTWQKRKFIIKSMILRYKGIKVIKEVLNKIR